MLKKLLVCGLVFALGACSTSQKSESPARATASAAKISKDTWLFSWTSDSSVLKDPKKSVLATLKDTQDCLVAMNKSKTPVKGCEGDGLYAGPGLYTCDNPFTSHDYGNIVIITQAAPGKKNYGIMAPKLPTELPKRSEYLNMKDSAILYNFRPSNYNGNALVIRNNDILDPSHFYAIPVATKGYKKFKDHSAYVCDDKSSVIDILENWGDQMEFMTLTFRDWNDQSGGGFLNGSHLNNYAYVAAFASDAVAIPDATLKKHIEILRAKSDSFKESFEETSCRDTSSVSLRACLANRLYTSIIGFIGTTRDPSYAWSVNETLVALDLLGLASSAETKGIDDPDKLLEFVANKVQGDNTRTKRIFEAYGCMVIFREGMSSSHLGLWSE